MSQGTLWLGLARLAVRLPWMAGEFLLFTLEYARRRLCVRGALSLPERARWVQWASRRLLRVCGGSVMPAGKTPSHGLLVCNHLSYLDILVLTAVTPAVFVAKREVRAWPVFGWLARMGGTLFVDRARRGDVVRLAEEMERAMETGVLLVLFPEGTSTNGRHVLPFKSSLLEPACRRPQALSAACLHYEMTDGDASNDACYWGDVTLLPHLLKLLARRGVTAQVRFTECNYSPDRKELAQRLHGVVVGLLASMTEANPSSSSPQPAVANA